MAADRDIPSGTLLDNRYLVQSVLGRGGFGRTYLALNQRRWGEPCVLKEFLPTVADDYVVTKSRELFEREAKTLYKLEHPQIPEFLDVFEEDDRQFLVQQYVAGKNYYQLLRERQRFSPAAIVQWLQDLLPVLDYIHSKNIIHRDISPDNIILPAQCSKPVLIDFGVVKETVTQIFARYTSNSGGAQASAVVGKTGYAAPEQLRTGECYPNSDLYSLGVTAVVLLTGNLEPGTLFDSFNEEWRWSQYVKVSPQFKAILDRMMAGRPKNRYQTAAEVLADLALLSLEPESDPLDSPLAALESPARLTGLSDLATEVNLTLPGARGIAWTETLPMVMTATEPLPEAKTVVEAGVAHQTKEGSGSALASLPPTPISPLPIQVALPFPEPETPLFPPPEFPSTPVSPLPAQVPVQELEPDRTTVIAAVAARPLPDTAPQPSGQAAKWAIATSFSLGLVGVALTTFSSHIPGLCHSFRNCVSPIAYAGVQPGLVSYSQVLALQADLQTLDQLDTTARKAIEPLAKLNERALPALSVPDLESKRQRLETSQTTLQKEVLQPLRDRLQGVAQDSLPAVWLQAAQQRYQADLKRTTTLVAQLDQAIESKAVVAESTAATVAPPEAPSYVEPLRYSPPVRVAPATPAPAPLPAPTQVPLCPGNHC